MNTISGMNIHSFITGSHGTGSLLLSRRVCSHVERAERPLVFNSEVSIESRASDSTSKAIFCMIIKKKEGN